MKNVKQNPATKPATPNQQQEIKMKKPSAKIQVNLDPKFTDLQNAIQEQKKASQWKFRLTTPKGEIQDMTLQQLANATGWNNRGTIYHKFAKNPSLSIAGYKIEGYKIKDYILN